jgi:hypothetical protein
MFFHSDDRKEPPHMHIERDRDRAKFWLNPVRLQYSRGFSRPEINGLKALVIENEPLLVKAWHEFFHS